MTALSRYVRKALWLLVMCAAALGLADLSAHKQGAQLPPRRKNPQSRNGQDASQRRVMSDCRSSTSGRWSFIAPRSPQAQSLSIRPIVIYTSSKETAEQYGTGSALGVTVFSGRAYNA